MLARLVGTLAHRWMQPIDGKAAVGNHVPLMCSLRLQKFLPQSVEHDRDARRRRLALSDRVVDAVTQ